MTDAEIFEKVIKRYKKVRGVTDDEILTVPYYKIIAFLEKEIDEYREKIEKLKSRLNSIYGAKNYTETLEAIQESTAGEIIKALSDNGYNVSINLFKNDESEVK